MTKGANNNNRSKTTSTVSGTSTSNGGSSTIADADSNLNGNARSQEESTTKANGGNKWNKNGLGQSINRSMGKFSAEESRLVREAIESYCKAHNITAARLCSETDNRTDSLRGAWMEISTCLQNRTVQSVYRHGLRLMHPFKRGVWTEEETTRLKLLVLTHGKKWAEIQSKLNRSADSCRDKYREFNNDYTKGRWQDEESKKLERFVREAMRVGDDVPMKELGRRVEEENIALPWNGISNKMGDRSRLSCFKRFQMLANIGPKVKLRRLKNSRNAPRATTQTAPPNAPLAAAHAAPVQGSDGETFSTSSTTGSVAVATNTKITSVIDQPITHIPPVAAIPNPTNSIAAAVAVDPPSLTHISMSTPNPIHPEISIAVKSVLESNAEDYDRILLNAVASSSYVTTSSINWSAFRYPVGNAEERWEELFDTFIENMEEEEVEALYDQPVYEVARLMLASGEEQAEIAARTVEAVFSL
jgi:hypothetical protein